MSFIQSEKLQQAQKANLELLKEISSTMVSSVEQLSHLQSRALNSAAEEQFETLGKLMAVRDPQSFVELQTSLLNPTAQVERLMEFNRQVYEVVSGTQSEIVRLTEKQIEAGAQHVQEIVEDIAKSAPAGAEPVVTTLKAAVKNAEVVYENVQKAAKQAAEFAQSGVAAAASAAGQANRNGAHGAAGPAQ
ncbi:phasin family protein [Pseudomonas saliphila]|uniref:phasin family protein n=1 Tax=Pseudomonas saliphila TaxID=2586906 RepID=UPI00123A9A42|nr:phasin family protein [Pseudomonas saliphila]